MIVLNGLTKAFGAHRAVDGVTLQIARGEVFGFLGPNGAGKTTTMRMLMGILVPTAGSASIAGLDCQTARVAVKRHVGYLPDAPMFYDYLRGREILEFVAQLHGQSPAAAATRASALAGQLGIAGDLNGYAANYSTGTKKKLALACSLVHDPDALILDEPTNGLDPRAARDVQALLQTYVQGGKTILVSTHLLDMAERLCHRIGIIHAGRLVAAGTVAEVKERLAPQGSLEDAFLHATRDA